MKPFSPLTEIENLKLIYHDILNGYSLDDSGVYVKHFSEQSYARVLERKRTLALSFRVEGLPTNDEREKEMLEQGLWTQDKEDRIEQLKVNIADNEKYSQGIIPSQKGAITAILDNLKTELASLVNDKHDIVGPTCEKFADREVENFFLLELFYRDSGLAHKYFSEDEFADLDYQELAKYKKILNAALTKIGEEHIRQLSCLPFFLNSLQVVKERPEKFFGKPISELTFHQHNLLMGGLRSHNIHSQAEGSPPSLADSTIQGLVEWYDKQHSIILGKNSKGVATSGLSITNTDVVR